MSTSLFEKLGCNAAVDAAVDIFFAAFHGDIDGTEIELL